MPATYTPASRAKELPDEYVVKDGVLFCKWCDKGIYSLRMDNLQSHIQSNNHQNARIKLGAKTSFDPDSETRLKFLAKRDRKKKKAQMKKQDAVAEEDLRKLFSNSDSEDTESFQGFDEESDSSENKHEMHSPADLEKTKTKQRRYSEPHERNEFEDSDDFSSPTAKEKVSYSARSATTASKKGKGSLKIKISRQSKSKERVHARSRSQEGSKSKVKAKGRSRSYHATESSENEDSNPSEKNVQIEPCGESLKLKFVLNKTKHTKLQPGASVKVVNDSTEEFSKEIKLQKSQFKNKKSSSYVQEISSDNVGSEIEEPVEDEGSENEDLEIENEEVIEEEIVEMDEGEFDSWEAIGPFSDDEKVEEEEEEEEIVSSIPPPPVLKEPLTQEENLAIKANHARQMAKSVNSAQFAKKAQKKVFYNPNPTQPVGSSKLKGRRISGYNMWASNIRRQIGSQFPGMQFGDVSKRVGDLWKKLPDKEKKMWKHKSMKMYQEQLRKMESSSATKRKHGSKMIETGPKKKTAFSSPPNKKAKVVSEPKRKQVYVQQSKRHSTLKTPTRAPASQQTPKSDPSIPLSPPHKNPAQMMERDLQKLPPPPIGLMDAAAHFAMLGETLTTIGNKVASLGNKHSGNVVVPLMLDSFMCSITPLLSLTNQIPGLQNSIPTKVMSDTLANVHNFMPGI